MPADRMRLALTTAAVLALLAASFGYRVSAPRVSSVTMPILVSGPDGTTERVTLNASDVANVDTLFLRAHSIGYAAHYIRDRGYAVDKASLRLNNGQWIDVNNETVDCLYPESQLGCVTGPYHTIRMKIAIEDLGSLYPGANTLDFRFNYACPDGEPCDISSGYRILNIALWNADTANTDAIDGTSFVWENPDTWTAPAGGDATAGEDLWQQRGMLKQAFGQRGTIRASCADCHAANGYDLQYFGYSNEVIIDRARFHDLTRQQGKDIAAYIRSVELTDAQGRPIAPPGRPWEPPYQPGPTALATRATDAPRSAGTSFEEADPSLWAAGAGLAWVLEDDADTYPYMWPNGPSYDDIDVAQRRIDLYEIPVALQMPDWNEWLPTHHPLDAMGQTFTAPPAGNGRCQTKRAAVWDYYENRIKALSDEDTYETVDNRLDTFSNRADAFRACHSLETQHNDTIGAGTANISVMQWAAVKNWEVIQTYHHAATNRDLYPNGSPLSWPGNERTVFQIAPHIVKFPDTEPESPKGGSGSCERHYYDAAWYHLQAIVNAGHGMHRGLDPVDWKYQQIYTKVFEGACGYDQAQRYFASLAKLFQLSETTPEEYEGSDPRPDEPEGWYLRHSSPIWFFQREEAPHWAQPIWDLNRAAPNAACHIGEEMLRFFTRSMTTEDMALWKRKRGQTGLEPSSFAPNVWPDPLKFDNTTYANHFYRLPSELNALGISTALQDSLMRWADGAWPQASPSYASMVRRDSACPPLGAFARTDRSLTTLTTALPSARVLSDGGR